MVQGLLSHSHGPIIVMDGPFWASRRDNPFTIKALPLIPDWINYLKVCTSVGLMLPEKRLPSRRIRPPEIKSFIRWNIKRKWFSALWYGAACGRAGGAAALILDEEYGRLLGASEQGRSGKPPLHTWNIKEEVAEHGVIFIKVSQDSASGDTECSTEHLHQSAPRLNAKLRSLSVRWSPVRQLVLIINELFRSILKEMFFNSFSFILWTKWSHQINS